MVSQKGQLPSPPTQGPPPASGLFSWGDLFLLALGAVLIFNHRWLWSTLLGIASWAWAAQRLYRRSPEGSEGSSLFRVSGLARGVGDSGPLAWVWSFGAYLLLLLLPHLRISLDAARWGSAALILIGLTLLLVLLTKTQGVFEAKVPSDPVSWHLPLLLVLGAAFLFHRFREWPFWMDNDCANCLLDSSYFLHGETRTPFRTVWGDNPALPYLCYSLGFKLFGASFFSGAAISSLAHLASLPYFYGFCRNFLPRGASLLAGALFASSRWLIFFIRTPREASLLPWFEAACLYHFVLALQTGQKRHYAGLGVYLALLMHTYLPSRAVLAFILSTLLVLALFHGRILAVQRNKWGLALGLFLLFMAPLGVWYLRHPSVVMGRMHMVSLFPVIREAGSLRPLWESIDHGLQMFDVQGGGDPHYNLPGVPMLDRVTGTCFWVGLAWILLRCFRFPNFFLLSGLGWGFLGVVLAKDFGHPMRGIAMVPFVMILAALGADRLARAFCALIPEVRRILYPVLLSAVAASAISFNQTVLFDGMTHNKEFLRSNDEYNFRAVQVLQGYPQGWNTYMDFDTGVAGRFAAYQRAKLDYWFPDVFLPVPAAPEKGVLLGLDGLGWVMEGAMREIYPKARVRRILFADGRVGLWFWELSPEDLREGLSGPPVQERFGIWMRPLPTTGPPLPARWWPALYGLSKWQKEWTPRSDRFFALFSMTEGRFPLRLRILGEAEVRVDGRPWGSFKSGNEPAEFPLAPFPPGAQVRVEYRPGLFGFDLDLFWERGNLWEPVPATAFRPAPLPPSQTLLTQGTYRAMGQLLYPD